MATMVYRGLQSCLDSPFIEPTWTYPHLTHPIQLAFKNCFILDSPEIPLAGKCNAHEIDFSNSPPTDDISGEPKPATAEQEEYVHPLVKRSRSALSEESLALCTENLGNETGADFVDGEFTTPAGESSPSTKRRVKENRADKRFPPPLTTISGLDSLMVRSHRKNGRLVIDAIKAPARLSYFQVERSHGRLRLSISNATFDSEEDDAEKEGETNDDVKGVGENRDYEEDVGRKVEEKEYANGVGAEMEIGKIERPCRCKEGENMDNNNGRMLNWEPVWVATT